MADEQYNLAVRQINFHHITHTKSKKEKVGRRNCEAKFCSPTRELEV
jgi:hypothetical protein